MGNLTLTGGRTIYYEKIEGTPGRPYLVFLHEGLGCIPMWKDFPERLCRRTGYPGLLYDREGYGRSSPLRSERTIHYVHAYALDELPEVLRQSIPGQPFILIGHSDGGSISLIYGAERSPYLEGIVSMAAHVFVEPETIAGIGEADEAFDQGKLQGLSRYHGEKTSQIFKAWSETWLSGWFRNWNIEYLLPAVACPVFTIQGADDRYGTRLQVDAIASKVSGRAEAWLIADCGHAPHLEKPEILVERIALFLEEIIG